MGGDNMAYYENHSPSSVIIGPGGSPVRQPQALVNNHSFERQRESSLPELRVNPDSNHRKISAQYDLNDSQNEV